MDTRRGSWRDAINGSVSFLTPRCRPGFEEHGGHDAITEKRVPPPSDVAAVEPCAKSALRPERGLGPEGLSDQEIRGEADVALQARGVLCKGLEVARPPRRPRNPEPHVTPSWCVSDDVQCGRVLHDSPFTARVRTKHHGMWARPDAIRDQLEALKTSRAFPCTLVCVHPGKGGVGPSGGRLASHPVPNDRLFAQECLLPRAKVPLGVSVV